MYPRLLLRFIQYFSFLQQYLIILSVSIVFLILFHYWWCILLLPLSTIGAYFAVQRLSRAQQSPIAFTGHLYDFFIRKRTAKEINESSDASQSSYQIAIQKECDTYIRTIIARYVAVWYYPLISTDQEFPEDLTIIFNMVLNRFNDRLKSLKIYDLCRLVIDLQQNHVEQYLQTLDSYRKQRKPNRTSKSLAEEFGQRIGFHPALNKNDIHSYIKAVVELFLTDLLPESFQLYMGSRTGREFLTQILTNAIFLPLFHRISEPRMIYYIIVLLWETDEQKRLFESEQNSLSPASETDPDPHDEEPAQLTEDFGDQVVRDDHREPSFERIIYTATILSTDRTYNSMSGAAYTVYTIQCTTKSPFVSNAIHEYTVRRRFREFLNLHKRLQQNPSTSRHCYKLEELFRAVPIPIDNMNPDVILRRRQILEQYIQILIADEALNSSHTALEFFAFNSDPNKAFEPLPSSILSVPRVDKALFRTLSDVGTRLISSFPTRRELTPLRETFQLNVSTVYENTSSTMDYLKMFVQQSSLRHLSRTSPLNTTDADFLQLLLTRPSIPRTQRREKLLSDIPLTDALLNLVHTCLHSRDAIVSYESVHQMLRTVFGHLVEKFLKNEIDDLLSRDQILTYLTDIRTKVLWPDDNTTFVPMRNVKHRAYNACMNKIPNWLQQMVGVENVRRIVTNALQCLSYQELNRHFLCNFFDLLVEQLIPRIATEDFLTRYVHMHAGVRS